jgi:dolichol-phosphate mannosyltransferase
MPLAETESTRLKPDATAATLTCAVVVPTYNERQSLPVLIRQLMDIRGVRVLVVDDASPDGTGRIAEDLAGMFPDRIEVMHRPGRSGLGSAYVDGMQRALAYETDLIAQMDADLSHDARYLPDLIARSSAADLVIGSRYVPGGGVSNWSLDRRLLSRFANSYVRVITGLDVRDATAGYRCWRRETLAALPLARLKSSGYSFQVEMVWEAVQRGFRVAEVPIVFVERVEGRSKLNWPAIVESMWLPWRLRRARATPRARAPEREGRTRA